MWAGDAVKDTAHERASRLLRGGKGTHYVSTITTRPIRNTATAATPTPEGTPPDPGTAPAPTVTHYQQLADDFSKALDQIVQIIPKLEITHPATANFVRSHLNVPTEFLATAIAAVEQTTELQHINKLDIAAARDTLQFIDAFRPVQDKVTALANSLKFTMASRKASLAADALQIYNIAKGIARDPGAAAVASLVQNLKRDLGRRGRPKGSVTAANQPAPPFTPAWAEEERPVG
jgi:AraC-like DNA-binding protein